MATFLNNFRQLEIQIEEIISATKNFDDSKVIGCGGFGKVYKGELTLLEGKSTVAFKRLDRRHGQGDPEFFKEIIMLSSYKHDNLISLLGYCSEGDEMILIYLYASQGSLDRILNDANLTWTQRLKICLGAAKGLGFLHNPNGSQQRVIHRDIKSANILLDENLNAKVSDFGLSRISPANQKYTFLVTSPVGTPGYCDPLYMDAYQLTKESDVYSFGVVLFEVLCGRVCYEYINGKLKVFVHFWKKCYEQKKLDEIIFPDIRHQLDPSSVKAFVDIAYQCLQRTREQRPTMSVVVEKLKVALKFQEGYDLKLQREHEQEVMRKAAEYEYREILKLADPPLIFKSVKELKTLISKGFQVNGGKTLLSVNDKGEVICERIYIESCLDPIQYRHLKDPSDFENSRFPGGRCYCKHEDELKVRVRAEFLCPLITYSLNLVFRNANSWEKRCKTLHYKIDGETKCCMVYDTYEREDGWFVVPLYQFTCKHKTADFRINFEGFPNGCALQIVGFEFQPREEKVELHDQWLEEYQDIVKAASQPLFYKSIEELKKLLSTGFHIHNHKMWFSLNENGEHCEMLSIEHCLISSEGRYYISEFYSRFPRFLNTNWKGFKVHIRTQFLTPSLRYTVNLVMRNNDSSKKQMYVALKYKLEGKTETSIVYVANRTKDNCSFTAELYQFTSNGRTFDLDIVFEDHNDYLEVEGILLQPLEKAEHEQVLEDEELSNDSLQWTMKKKDLGTKLLKWFRVNKGQEGYAVDNNGKKSLTFSARGAIRSHDKLSFKSSPESRFGEVAVVADYNFKIEKEIKTDVLSPETAYATYLIYKLTQDQSQFNGLLEIFNCWGGDPDYRYIYLVSPPETPIIGQKLDQISHNQPLIRHKVYAVPQQRKDGWMELKVWQFQTPQSSTQTIHMDLDLRTPDEIYISGLIIESIELRPIVGHSV